MNNETGKYNSFSHTMMCLTIHTNLKLHTFRGYLVSHVRRSYKVGMAVLKNVGDIKFSTLHHHNAISYKMTDTFKK